MTNPIGVTTRKYTIPMKIGVVTFEIASAIADALGERLGMSLQSGAVRVRAGTENLGAYELFLQARTFFPNPRSFRNASSIFTVPVSITKLPPSGIASRALVARLIRTC